MVYHCTPSLTTTALSPGCRRSVDAALISSVPDGSMVRSPCPLLRTCTNQPSPAATAVGKFSVPRPPVQTKTVARSGAVSEYGVEEKSMTS